MIKVICIVMSLMVVSMAAAIDVDSQDDLNVAESANPQYLGGIAVGLGSPFIGYGRGYGGFNPYAGFNPYLYGGYPYYGYGHRRHHHHHHHHHDGEYYDDGGYY